MEDPNAFAIVWLTGASCDGCTIRAIGDTTAGGLEALLTGTAPGLPRLRLIHPVLSMETGDEFIALLNAAIRGDLGPFGLVVEASLPDDTDAGQVAYSTIGWENGEPVPVGTWLHRLAGNAEFVVAWGDCAVWGGPHSIGSNPVGAGGVATRLGWDYRSRMGLPVVHLPGCSPPPTLISTLAAVLHWRLGTGPEPELDELYRPIGLYNGSWAGAFVAWSV